MGERIVADFEGYFGDVTSTASEQERSLFDAKGAEVEGESFTCFFGCLLYTSPSPRDRG